MKKYHYLMTSALITGTLLLSACKADLDQFVKAADEIASSSAGGTHAPTSIEMATAIREALGKGTDNAVALLGKTNGFYTNQWARIPLPDELQKADQLLRKIGLGDYADQFVLAMNRAAEEAVPKASSIFSNAIRQMSIRDALDIIRGPKDAATQYFRRTSEKKLIHSFRPSVEKATNWAGVTRYYKTLIGKTSLVGLQLSADARDIDGYVTQKAVDALFLFIAREEQMMRENPAERTTEVVKKVFGYYLDQ